MMTSCDDIGRFTLSFTAATDDRAPTEPAYGVQVGVGYVLRVVRGAFPDGHDFGGVALTASLSDDGTASLPMYWLDGATDTQEVIDLTLGVTAVDLAGNESEEVTVEVYDPGYAGDDAVDTIDDCAEDAPPTEERLCAVGYGAVAPLLTLAALGTLLVRRRASG